MEQAQEGAVLEQASLISVRFIHKWRSSTTKLTIDLPMACAVTFAARRVVICCTTQLSESCRIGSRLILRFEKFGLKDLEHSLGVQSLGCLPGRGVSSFSEGRCCSAQFGGVSDLHFPYNDSGRVEVCCH